MTPICPHHNKEMRGSAATGWYCPTKVPEGSPLANAKGFCNHRVPKDAPAHAPATARGAAATSSAPETALKASVALYAGRGDGTDAVVLLTAEKFLTWLHEKGAT